MRFCVLLLLCCVSLLAQAAKAADPVSITVLHTNDLHSQFRPQKDVIGLGGVARLKTTIDSIRKAEKNTLLLDGGDWSEGQIYYTLNNGTEVIRMMEHMGYDAAVVGNHDWINGPDQLLSMYKAGRSRMSLLAANIDLSRYTKKDEFKKVFLPYTIYTLNGIRVAVIGLVTYEFIYDNFFTPVRIVSPLPVIRDLALNLRNQVDSIIVLSHNSLRMNEEILRTAPDVDLVVGAHDHVKLTQPRIVLRGEGKKPGWLVETGCWGRYLGRVDIKVRKRMEADELGIPSVELRNYQLIQMDPSIPSDPATVARIEWLENQIENTYGPMFKNPVAHSDFEVRREGAENLMGNLAADSYLQTTRADFAFDQVDLIYGQLYAGDLTPSDFFGAHPAVYNFQTAKTWPLSTFQLKGSTLRWLLNLLFAKPTAGFGPISASGLSFTYTSAPPKSNTSGNTAFWEFPVSTPFPVDNGSESKALADENFPVKDILIQGQPLNLNRFYTVASSGGILFAIQFINRLLPGAIRIHNLKDTGVESWRVMMDYVASKTPFKRENIIIGNRIKSLSQDLGLFESQIDTTVLGMQNNQLRVQVRVPIKNYGITATAPSANSVLISANRRGTDFASEPDWLEVAAQNTLPAIVHQEELVIEKEVLLTGTNGIYPMRVQLMGEATTEINTSNNETIVFVRSPEALLK